MRFSITPSLSIRWALMASAATFSALGLTSLAQAEEPMKVGFIYVGPASGAGWSFAHELARREVQKTFGDKVETIFVEKVAEADGERVTRDLVSQGPKGQAHTLYR